MTSDVVSFTAELVRLPSVLGNEAAVAQAVVQRMGALGYDAIEIDRAGNAIGVINGAAPGPTLLFDGHIDTVDVVPREAWRHDPFGGEIVDGRMYGRGTSDMKGAVAAMVYGAASVDRSAIRGRIVVSASVGEEWVEGRALKDVLDRFPADFVVIGESSDLNIVRAGRGRAEFVVTTHGKPAHASRPALGVNAVHAMFDVARRIEALPMPSNPDVGDGIMTLTDIVSSPYPGHSVVPSGCRATFERRLMPGETQEGVLREVSAAAGERVTVEYAQLDYTTYTGVHWTQPKWFPAWVTPADHPLVTRAQTAMTALGFAPKLTSYQFCTNAAYAAGVLGIPTIGLGPSSETLAHIIDEYIEIEQLEAAARAYRAVAESVLA